MIKIGICRVATETTSLLSPVTERHGCTTGVQSTWTEIRDKQLHLAKQLFSEGLGVLGYVNAVTHLTKTEVSVLIKQPSSQMNKTNKANSETHYHSSSYANQDSNRFCVN